MPVRVLLDTNVVIHREAQTVVNASIGLLFRWLDKLKIEKCVHPATVTEIQRHSDAKVVQSFERKIASYAVLKTTAPMDAKLSTLAKAVDQNQNDRIDTAILNEIIAGRVDWLITEDRNIHNKANQLGFASSVFTIDSFLEKVTTENPDLLEYKVLSVRKALFGNVNLADSFFDSFRSDYREFDRWFNRKADETAYICTANTGQIIGFLYLKNEGQDENYSDIEPRFAPKRRLKIGTFKVTANGFKIGERFLKIIFDNAIRSRVDEIYVTIFEHTDDQARLIALLQDWGFTDRGVKNSPNGSEKVLMRNFAPSFDSRNPKLTYPFMSKRAQNFIVPIYPEYHTELFPDSILNTESPLDFVENRPNRNAISKVYVSRSYFRDLQRGDLLVFYRTGSGSSAAWYTAVATTIGIVESVELNIQSLQEFIQLCRKRSVFSDAELKKFWDFNPRSRPFIVNFLYTYSLPIRPNRQALIEGGFIDAEPPRGFKRLRDGTIMRICELSGSDLHYLVD
jgi:predicted nucleic acid-binding protein